MATSQERLQDAREKALTTMSHSINDFDEIGVNRMDMDKLVSFFGIRALRLGIERQIQEVKQGINEQSDHNLSEARITARTNKFLLAERKKLFKQAKKMSKSFDGALVSLGASIVYNEFDVELVTSLCNEFGAARVAELLRADISLKVIPDVINNDVDTSLIIDMTQQKAV
jgi:hypothetical protein